VHEETGLTLGRYELFGHFSDPSRIIKYPDGNVVRVISFAYLVQVASFAGLRASDESEQIAFFDTMELRQLDLAATHRHIVDLYLSGAPYPHLE
jgi:ADP-ribose pyrophosphatase YjhB (NUDIX family)